MTSPRCLAFLLGVLSAPVLADETWDGGAGSPCKVRLEFVREGQHVPGLHFAFHASQQDSLRAVTDVQGWATLEFPRGEWTMFAPQVADSTSFSVACPGVPSEVRIELPRRTVVQGRVVDARGAPMAGVEVAGLGSFERLVDLEPYTSASARVLTNHDGRFELTFFGEQVTLTAWTARGKAEWAVVKGDRVTLTIAAAEFFSPRVAGPAAPKRYVDVRRSGASSSISTVLEPGKLQLRAGSYTALVRQEAEGRTWSGHATFDVVPGNPVTPTIELQPVVLQALVVRGGRPVADVPVEVVSEGWPAEFWTHQSDKNWAGSGVSGRDGVVTISPKLHLAAPKFFLRVTQPGTAKTVEASLGGPRVIIELPEQVTP